MTKLRPALNTLKGKTNLTGCEIGVFRGVNALAILEHLDIKLLYLIDPYPPPNAPDYNWYRGLDKNVVEDRKKAIALVQSYTDRKITKWIFKRSANAHVRIADSSLDFVYIDGNHIYEFCFNDIKLYLPKLKPGGLMSGHDFQQEGVKKAVRDFISESSTSLNSGGSDWWFIK